MTAHTGVWLHAVARDLDPALLAGLAGVGGSTVRMVAVGRLTAVVCPVDLAEFGEQQLRRNLEDLAWLESVARDHHRVAESLARLGPVVPARLATIYRDDDAVARLLTRRHADFAEALDRVAGRVEWGVKAYARADPETGTPPSTPGSGADYLRRRRAALSAREDARRATVRTAQALHAELTGSAEASREHPPQPRSLTGRPGWMVLNGTYLVDAGRARSFAAAARALADRYPAVELELTGPWPPYSFATLPAEEGSGDA